MNKKINKGIREILLGISLSLFSLYVPVIASAQLNIEAIFDSSNGSSGLDIQDVTNTTQVFIDSDGNIVTRGCVRLDDGLVECTSPETLIVDGTLGIGVTAPASVFHVNSNTGSASPIVTVENTAGDFQIHVFVGNPESNVVGSPGDLCVDPTGGMVYIKSSGAVTNTGWSEIATGGGMPQWTQTGTVVHPNTTTDNVGIGGTSEPSSVIFFGSDGRAVFNEQGSAVDFRVEGDLNQNLLFIDGSADRIGIGTGSPAAGTILDLSATDAALRVTRLSNPLTDIATPRNGMIAYDSTDNELQAYVNGSWVMLAEGGMIDISDDTNLTAGFGITITGDTVSVQDIYVQTAGDSMTGSLQFVGVGSDITTGAGEDLALMPASGRVGVGTTAPALGTILDLSATDAALRVTRLSNPLTDIATPRNGMIAYDSTDNELQAYVNGSWVMLAEGGMIDISDDTNLTAGFGITITGDTVSVQDIYVQTAGDSMTGSLQFVGVGSDIT
ncbi:MAG: hypothetical protein AB7S78_08105, partial [Candidatus Omnitrophota bacterium]